MYNPLVSIIIPTYNRAHLISETLNSVLVQTYTNWECVIVDDGSIDNTESVVMDYVNKDARFQFHKRPENYKSGGNGARNYGAEMTSSNFLIFFDSDDLLVESALDERMMFVKKNEFDLLINNTATFKREIGDSELLWNIFDTKDSITDLLKRFLNNDMPWQTNGATWSKDFFKKTGGWNEKLSAWQDWEIHIRALLLNPKILHLNPFPDTYYRLESNNSIKDGIKEVKYYRSVRYALFSVCKSINRNKLIKNKVKKELNKLTIRILIKMPLYNNFYFFLFRNLCETGPAFCLNKFQFLKICFIEVFGKSTKVKMFLIKKIYIRHHEYMKVPSYFLKLTKQDIKPF
ncbi:glycosyltransferase family A protein [Flavobacterium sp. H122]|uniref:glycosyltransferase family 2 protein n=1 Tax=Flavobacterium sp. H122 TaxID=2529860 RepID=UPI0010AB0C33|nr:glycosyltransferase family A protein [Flavobacterium sp. H122]